MDRKKLVKTSIFLIFFIFIVNFLASKFYLYSAIWWFDMFVHFLGGVWIGFVSLSFFVSKNTSLQLILKVLFFVLFVGVGWEVFEIIVNDIIAQNPFDYIDTFSDLLLDLSGGLCAILYVWKKTQKKLSK